MFSLGTWRPPAGPPSTLSLGTWRPAEQVPLALLGHLLDPPAHLQAHYQDLQEAPSQLGHGTQLKLGHGTQLKRLPPPAGRPIQPILLDRPRLHVVLWMSMWRLCHLAIAAERVILRHAIGGQRPRLTKLGECQLLGVVPCLPVQPVLRLP